MACLTPSHREKSLSLLRLTHRNLDVAMDLVVAGEESEAVVDDLRLDVIADKPLDFDSWMSLISHVEKLYADDEEKICSTYDSFLSDFPLCYGYWRKYAAHRIRLCTFDKIVEVFERAVQAVTYSVDVWLDYSVFCTSLFPDPNEVRRQFKRGLLYVGRDYLCHTLWDKYIEFEFSQQDWSALAYIYIQILRYPKKMLCDYYDRFTQLVAMFKEEMELQGAFVAEIDSTAANEGPAVYKDDEILGIIKDLLDQSDNLSKSNAWWKYKLIGESLYRKSSHLDEKIKRYENQIRRPYFHVKPLDERDLENWHQYLDFVEKQGDFDWAVKLYERCLIPCALYTDFWIRYAQLLENKGGRELANFALDRATKTFLKTVPCMHLFNARYQEQTKDFSGARAAFPKFNNEELDSEFISNVMKEANMEKRLGNNEAAYRVYREAIELTTKRQDLDTLARLYIHYSRLTYKATNRVDAALGILTDGIKQIPNCKSLLKELIKFGMMHGGPKDMSVVDSVVANFLSSEESEIFSLEEKESISSFYLEFVDLCGTIDDVMKVWARHIRLFPHSVRTASNVEPPVGRKSEEVSARSSKDLCLDMPPPTCRPSSLDQLDQPQIENLAEPGGQPGSEAGKHSPEKLGVGSVPSSNLVAVCSTADLSVQDTDNVDPMREAEGSETRHEDDHGIERNLNSLCLGGVTVITEDKGSPVGNATQDADGPDLEDTSRKRTHENTLSADRDPSVSSSMQRPHLGETHDVASSDSGQGVRGNPSTADQRLVQSSLSPAGTPRSESSHIPRPFRDPSSTSNEGFTRSLQGDWHLRRRPDRFIKDPHLRYRPHRQRRPSPPRHSRSESDHIITIQSNATQPLPVKTQQARDNQTQFQQPWARAPYNQPTNLAAGYSWPVQNPQQSIASTLVHQLPTQPTDQGSVQMPQYNVQISDPSGQMQNQQAYGQMMQFYYYQQQVPQQWQQAPDQWQQQQQYWLQLQYQQQLAQGQAPMQMQQPPAQAPMLIQQQSQMLQQQLQGQAPMQMQQPPGQAPMLIQQLPAQAPPQQAQVLQQQETHTQPQPGTQAPLLQQQQLQQLLELQQLRKQQQQQQAQPQPQQEEEDQKQQPPAPSSPFQSDTSPCNHNLLPGHIMEL